MRDEAEDVIDAYSAGVAALPNSFAAWGALPLRAADPSYVERVLDAGFVGVSIPAGVIASPSGLERVGPLLEVAQRRAAPVFVHPGLDPFAAQAPAGSDAPFWFPALTSYVAQMNTAWHSFAAVGRKLLPDLQAVFAILAGGAPLHLERLVARGGPAARALNHNFFYETSSYGERAIEAVARVVGIDQLLHGSDRPVVAPPAPPGPLGAAAWDAMTRTTPARLFSTRTRTEIAA